MAGALVGLGIPELQARRYEGRVQGGNILISVHTESSDERACVTKIFGDLGADDICAVKETPVPTQAPRGSSASTM